MTERPICNYEGSQYSTEFWTPDRAYEDAAERIALRALLPQQGRTLIEIGAGFGRLTDLYAGYDTVVMMDYARTQLEQAVERWGECGPGGKPRYVFVQADFYRLPFVAGLFDTVTMVRVLHHAADAPAVLQGVSKILGPQGALVMEFANKQNIKAIARYLLGKQSWSPFDQAPVEFVALNFDFHPQWIEQHLENAGLRVRSQRSVSHFRIGFLKRYVPTSILTVLDGLIQPTGNLWQLSPSVFVHAVAGAGKDAATPGQFFRCPACGQALGDPARPELACMCGKTWRRHGLIYDFRGAT